MKSQGSYNKMAIQKEDAAVLHYDNRRFPLRIKDVYEVKDENIVIPHWHDDFELVYVLEGINEYRINDDALILQPGDFLFINTRVMHYNHAIGDGENHGYFVIFQPSILTGNTYVAETFLEPIWKVNPLEYLYLPRNTEQADEIGKWMKLIVQAYKESPDHYQLQAIAGLNMIMNVLYKEFSDRNPAVKQTSPIGILEKKMISFIYHRFADRITLQDIADSANVSIRTCSNIFQHYAGVSPMKYLNLFRMDMAARLLQTSDAPVQSIAWNCGFETSAYFIKQFKKQYGCTPNEYRKAFRK